MMGRKPKGKIGDWVKLVIPTNRRKWLDGKIGKITMIDYSLSQRRIFYMVSLNESIRTPYGWNQSEFYVYSFDIKILTDSEAMMEIL